MKKDTSYGVIVVWDNKVLLIKQRYGNFWGLPKGHPEVDETPIESAIRELEEETGVSNIVLDSDFQIEDKYSFLRDQEQVEKTVVYFVGRLDKEPNIKVQEEEVLDCKWVDIESVGDALTRESTKEMWVQVLNYLK